MKKYFNVERLTKGFYHSIPEEDNIILSEIQMDYNTVVMSPEFRRMQDKTQVFPLSRGDYVRTRLTHSYEVSIIAEQIARYSIIYLENKKPSRYDWDDTDKERFVGLSKTVGLIHDVGNPPFGHFGEDCVRNYFVENHYKTLFLDEFGNKVKLKDFINSSNTGYPLYEDFLNYDGNVQGLRTVLTAHPTLDGQGFNLTKSLLHSMIKYPHDSQTARSLGSKKHGYNYAEKKFYEEIIAATESPNPRHVVTYILEAADDIAYRTADIEDAFKKEVITIFDIHRYLDKYLDKENRYDRRIFNSFMSFYDRAVEDEGIALEYVRDWLYEVRLYLMKSVAHQFAEDFDLIEEGKVTYYELTEMCYGKNFFDFAKHLTAEQIYDNDSVLDQEVAAKAVMYDLLELFIDAMIPFDMNMKVLQPEGHVSALTPTYYQSKIIKLIPREFLITYENEKVEGDEAYNLYLRILTVLDYISSMTDRYAYEKRRTLTGNGQSY